MFRQCLAAARHGPVAVGATIYWGSPNRDGSSAKSRVRSRPRTRPDRCTILWCYLRNPAYQAAEDYHLAADLTCAGQPSGGNGLGVRPGQTEASQTNMSLLRPCASARSSQRLFRALEPQPHRSMPLSEWSLPTSGRSGRLISSGGASGAQDLAEAVANGRDQQARWRYGPDQRTQGVSAAARRRHRAAACDPGVYLCGDVTIA